MQIVLDILIAVVFAFLLFRGFRRGFMKSVLSLGRLVLSFVFTILFGARFSAWINLKFVEDPVHDVVFKQLSKIADEVASTAGNGVDAFIEKIPDSLKQYVDTSSVDPSAELNTLVADWSTSIGAKISILISTIIGYLLLFLLLFILLTVVIFIVGKLAHLPLIHGIDKILGLGLGLISGFISVAFLSTIAYAILKVCGRLDIFESSVLLKFFYNLHIFQFILNKIL